MFEKVNPQHPDKVADRIAGAVVDLAYTKADNPKIAVEVLLGHGECTVMIEASVMIGDTEVEDIVHRIAGNAILVHTKLTSQDIHLANNQQGAVRCGDNGIFKGCAPTHEQKLLTAIAASIYDKYPHDGKYLLSDEDAAVTHRGQAWTIDRISKNRVNNLHFLTICQSHADRDDLTDIVEEFFRQNGADMMNETNIGFRNTGAILNGQCYGWGGNLINPLGEWTGGPDVDCGATNRKLGSDMGDGVTGGGLCGKDLSKGDVSINIVCFLKAVQSGQMVTACCSIGDEQVTFQYASGKTETETFADIVEMARLYIMTDCGGSFETFSEWGLIRHKDY